ncbi:nucleoporin-domain-containing protein [Nemania sp. FL0916]|nr:nucleoporin-domain-containing protein [Nemania sp. FL0916]
MAMQTPGQALPGAFLNTPAVASRFNAPHDPVRRRLFPPASVPPAAQQQQPRPAASQDVAAVVPNPARPAVFGSGSGAADNGAALPGPQAPALPQPPLAKAAALMNNALALDEHYPELGNYCRQLSSDYEVAAADSPWAPFQETRKFQIPQCVLQQYQRGEVSTAMGLFAELNHAWVAIDNCLYLWDYTHPNPELIGYEDGQYSITAVKLVAPKPGVFNSIINHILVVATSRDMILLGLSAKQAPTGSKTIELYGTKMALNTNGNPYLIAGSASGRVFFVNRNESDIYELYYQQEEKWFSSRTGKINHTDKSWSTVVPRQPFWGRGTAEHIVDLAIDDSRNLLYTLSSVSTVRTYSMEAPDKLTKVIEKTKNDILRDIAHALSVASPLLTERMRIVSISPISVTEDNKLHLMALTDTGCRLFMSATSASSYMLTAPGRAPQSMQLQSVKFPPPEAGQRRPPQADPFNGPGEPIYTGSNTLTGSRRGARFPPGYFIDFVSRPERPEYDVLFFAAPDSGRIKNNGRTQGLKFYEQANWIDIGARAEDIGLVGKPFSATNQPTGFGNELAVQFDDPSGSEFAILTNAAVHIIKRRRLVDIFASAIRTTAGEEGLKSEVNKFLSAFGRVETITAALAVACRQGDLSQFGLGRSALDQSTLDRAKQVFINFGGNPTLPEPDGQPATVDMVRPSSRHGAITLYLSRLIRSLWKSKVISTGANGAGAFVVNSVIAQTKLREVQDGVIALRNFLNNNRPFIQGLSGSSDLQKAATKQEELALQGEHQAMHAVEVLMTDITEGISFVTTLFEERVTDIYTRLDETSQRSLLELTYENLFSQAPGKQLAKVLVKAIVNRNIENGSNVETVADALRRKCGSFCSADDVVVFKAQEQLKKASEPSLNPNVSRTLLHDSLKHFEKVATTLSHANLESAIQQYIHLKYYAGAIQLCLAVAEAKDRGKQALYWVNDGKPDRDPRSKAFDQRKACYHLVHQVLLDLDVASSTEPEMIDNKPTLIATKRAEAYNVVNSSTDEVFHGWTERLLAIESPYVTTFLRRLASKDVAHAELLYRFYTMRGMFFDAAKVQLSLAKSDFALSINDRLKLLSRAKTNASVVTAGISRQEQQFLNHEVTELLDSDTRIAPEKQPEIQKALDGKIQGLSDLYNSYADQAGYHDLCLIMYHIADLRNPTTVSQTWASLIRQTHSEAVERLAAYDRDRQARGAAAGDHPAQPYEVLIAQIEAVRHRSSQDSFVFPVPTLLPDICRYAVENSQDGRIGADVHWPVQLFLHLDVSHDLVVRVLESMFEAQAVPFRGAGRARLVEWISHAVDLWARDIGRHGRPDARLEPWVAELMAECDAWASSNIRGANEGGASMRDIARNVKDVRRAVEGLVMAPVGRGSIGFF